jgi:nucleoside 2-deoxyribosyltransferase
LNVYVIGSLRSLRVPVVAAELRAAGHDVYDDWYSPGPEADDRWQAYERQRGRRFAEAVRGWHATHVFQNDKRHLDQCDAAVLVMPAGKSAHLELGYAIGRGQRGYVLLDGEPERFDIMYRFADNVVYTVEELLACL